MPTTNEVRPLFAWLFLAFIVTTLASIVVVAVAVCDLTGGAATGGLPALPANSPDYRLSSIQNDVT